MPSMTWSCRRQRLLRHRPALDPPDAATETDGVAPLGTTGEGNSLPYAFRLKVGEHLAEAGIAGDRAIVGTGASAVADAVSDLGWRSPMRTTAMATLTEGVTGNPSAWDGLGLRPLSPLRDTLASMPATAEDRLFARMSYHSMALMKIRCPSSMLTNRTGRFSNVHTRTALVQA